MIYNIQLITIKLTKIADAAIVLTLVVMDLGEQAGLQKFLTWYRMIAFLLLFVTMGIKLSVESSSSEIIWTRIANVGAFQLSKFAKGFGPSMLAVTCHYNMPDAIQPLRTKENAKSVAFVALGISCVFYFALGLLGATSFDDVNPLITLNWSTYTGIGNGWEDPVAAAGQPSAPAWSVALKLFVLIFPLVNVTSSFPMIGVTVGDNLFPIFPQAIKSRLGTNLSRKLCRLSISVPPIVMALLFHRLDDILTVGGFFGFVMTLLVPCAFQYYGRIYCNQRFGNDSITPFTVPFWSDIGTTKVVFWLSVIITVVAIVTAF